MIQPQLTYSEDIHEYRWYNKPVVSSTQVLSSVGTKTIRNGIELWNPIGFNDRFLSDETAANFGKAFHKIASILLLDGIPGFPAAMEPYVKMFRKFLSDFPFVVLEHKGEPLVECPLYSERYCYAGTPDVWVLEKGGKEIWLLDWKTSTQDQGHWNYQTASYEQLGKEVFGFKMKIVRKTVRFTEENYFVRTRDNMPQDFNGFLSCLNVLKLAA